MNEYEIVLASGSPRRKQLLSDLGFSFDVVTADIDESPLPGESPIALAERLAVQKAMAVRVLLTPSDRRRIIIAADTVVAMGNELFGKPADEADAFRMLARLRDEWHQVHSAVCVMDAGTGRRRARVNTTQIRMRNYTPHEIRAYVAGGDPLDKAGAYAIQHPGFAPVSEIDGCITGVMGLPLADLYDLLCGFGVDGKHDLAPVCERQASFVCCQRDMAQDVKIDALTR